MYMYAVLLFNEKKISKFLCFCLLNTVHDDYLVITEIAL